MKALKPTEGLYKQPQQKSMAVLSSWYSTFQTISLSGQLTCTVGISNITHHSAECTFRSITAAQRASYLLELQCFTTFQRPSKLHQM